VFDLNSSPASPAVKRHDAIYPTIENALRISHGTCTILIRGFPSKPGLQHSASTHFVEISDDPQNADMSSFFDATTRKFEGFIAAKLLVTATVRLIAQARICEFSSLQWHLKALIMNIAVDEKLEYPVDVKIMSQGQDIAHFRIPRGTSGSFRFDEGHISISAMHETLFQFREPRRVREDNTEMVTLSDVQVREFFAQREENTEQVMVLRSPVASIPKILSLELELCMGRGVGLSNIRPAEAVWGTRSDRRRLSF